MWWSSVSSAEWLSGRGREPAPSGSGLRERQEPAEHGVSWGLSLPGRGHGSHGLLIRIIENGTRKTTLTAILRAACRVPASVPDIQVVSLFLGQEETHETYRNRDARCHGAGSAGSRLRSASNDKDRLHHASGHIHHGQHHLHHDQESRRRDDL